MSDVGENPMSTAMLGEIRDGMDFLAAYLSSETGEGKIPRRKVVMLTEQLANLLIQRYRGLRWDPAHPELDSEKRVVDMKVGGFTSPLIERASEAVGLPASEVLAHLPDCLRLYIDPGQVHFSIGSHGLRQRIRSANSAASASAWNFSEAFSNLHLGNGDASTPHLKLTSNFTAMTQSGVNRCKVFEASANSDVKFTVASFATTRFGTAKQKSSLALMKQIQAKVKEEPVFSSSQLHKDQENANPLHSLFWNDKSHQSAVKYPTQNLHVSPHFHQELARHQPLRDEVWQPLSTSTLHYRRNNH